MNETNVSTLQARELVLSRIEGFKKKNRQQAYIALSFWTIVTIVMTIGIFSIFNLHDSPLRGLIYSFVISIVLVNWFVQFPFFIVLTIIVIRTRSRNFFFQIFPNVGLQILITVAAFSPYIQFEEDLFTMIFIGFLLLLVVLECIFLSWVINGVKHNKKPLFFWTFFQDTFEAYSSTVLSQQALLITDQQDGYSQRPFFASFPEISRHCTSPSVFKSKMEEYARFLTERSELIGWDIDENSAILYPRVLMGRHDFGLGIRYLWDLLIRIYKKKELTTISISFESREISIRIAREDYDLLSEVTYHLLSQQILERFKQSIITFMEASIEESYKILFPLKH
ncbi:MAG: hypothetical protein ACXAEU_17470 [Candidatus Hodarchaeales archaeon]